MDRAGCRLPGALPRSWSVFDFVLMWLGGQLGALLAVSMVIGGGDAEGTFLATIVGQYVGALGVFWLLARNKDSNEIGFVIRGGDFAFLALGLVLQMAVALLFLPISELLFPDGRPQQEVAESLANAETTLVQIVLVFAYVVVGPAVEELTYRGVLLRALEPRGKWFAIIVSSTVFAAIHLPGIDLSDPWRSALLYIPPFLILGMLLAWLTLRNGRLGPAIFLHSGWNLLAAFVLLLPPELIEQVG